MFSVTLATWFTMILFLTSETTQQEDRQKEEDHTNDLLKAYEETVDYELKENKQFPHVNNGNYIQNLVKYISKPAKKKAALIVGGPKDSGKSTGLLFLSKAASKLGHNVIHLNLKSSVDEIDVKELMVRLSWDVIDAIFSIKDGYKLKCVFYEVIECPGIKTSWNVVFEQIVLIFKWIVQPFVIGLIIDSVLQAIRHGVAFIISKIRFLCFACLLFMIVIQSDIFNFSTNSLYGMYLHGSLMQYRIGNGDWSTVFCCLNSIVNCTSHEPVFIVKDVKNFQMKHLHKFLSAVQPKKERHGNFFEPRFPVIIETSDNLWMQEIYLDTSNSAYEFYYMEPVSYEIGKKEMVEKYQLFDDKTYDKLFNLFGGHIRFYEYFWMASKDKIPYDDIIDELIKGSEIILTVCLIHVKEKERRDEIISLFEQLKKSNYTLYRTWLSSTDESLISCNLLFYQSDRRILTVQNPLLQKAIDNILPSLKTL